MPSGSPILTDVNIHDYFRDQLHASIAHQHVAVGPPTVQYLTRLLAEFTASSQLFTPTENGCELKPLALHYADAVYADGVHARNLALKRLGDIALFIAGVFSGSLARKIVDVDYYAAMGGGAYRHLHDLCSAQFNLGETPLPFAELAEKFLAIVDVLSEVAEESHLGAKPDVLREFELWMRTGSPRARQQLIRRGIAPTNEMLSRARH